MMGQKKKIFLTATPMKNSLTDPYVGKIRRLSIPRSRPLLGRSNQTPIVLDSAPTEFEKFVRQELTTVRVAQDLLVSHQAELSTILADDVVRWMTYTAYSRRHEMSGTSRVRAHLMLITLQLLQKPILTRSSVKRTSSILVRQVCQMRVFRSRRRVGL